MFYQIGPIDIGLGVWLCRSHNSNVMSLFRSLVVREVRGQVVEIFFNGAECREFESLFGQPATEKLLTQQ